MSGQLCQFIFIDTLRLVIMGGKLDISFLFRRIEIWNVSTVQFIQQSFVTTILPDTVQHVQKMSITLSINFLQFNGTVLRLPQCAAGKEIGSIIIAV